ncbi:hypothetical protein K493DRAFT_291014 [Basidiobolus meristosporus CBS 931.73]|uniref:RING-type E3 ubiquitin transferase n=1 Tax=Basidiobolus meristosporus CBS 931.73 TaxID=1314790 RepID=A0A1Y1XNM1_9FUNG|nr:hypothetical protein K493DRAFT_291014 [Basidiobolus meristosporus CBS 931.73]|eukprot:ORX87349.1 hypothetical protein K493DRAFT_291014 [Basidiobolus meristosporus CBS 931.73]
MEDDEVEICRVCRSEGTPEDPLFYPCKCSGSIKFVHQDCLIQWLSHSKKKYCELCKHPFTFTPIYDPAMPENIPFLLFLKRIPLRIFLAIQTWIRAIFVAFMWLIFLPYVTVWMVRFYFWLGDVLAFAASGEEALLGGNRTSLPAGNDLTSKNVSSSLLLDALSNMDKENSDFYRDLAGNFLADCFEGQIITCVIVVLFVTGFLIREWILQNGPIDMDGLENNNPNIREFQPPVAPAPPPPPQAPELREDNINRLLRPPLNDNLPDSFGGLNQPDNRRRADPTVPADGHNVFGEENSSFSFNFVPPNTVDHATEKTSDDDSQSPETSMPSTSTHAHTQAMSSMSIEDNLAGGLSMGKGKSKSASALFTSDILTWENLFKASIEGSDSIDWSEVSPRLFMKPFGEAKDGLTEEQIQASQAMRDRMVAQKSNGSVSIFPSDILVWEQLVRESPISSEWNLVDPRLFMKPFGSLRTGFSADKMEEISKARAMVVSKFFAREFGKEHLTLDSLKGENSSDSGLDEDEDIHFEGSVPTLILSDVPKDEAESGGLGGAADNSSIGNDQIDSDVKDEPLDSISCEEKSVAPESSKSTAVISEDLPLESTQDLLTFEDGVEPQHLPSTSDDVFPTSIDTETLPESSGDGPSEEADVAMKGDAGSSSQAAEGVPATDNEDQSEPEELELVDGPPAEENGEEGGIFQHIRNWVENLEDDEQIERNGENDGNNEPAAVNEENANNGGDIPLAEGNAGDDLDGVLEAIGMRGPFWMLFQNSLLMVVLISFCLSLAVCLPYSIGKTVILIKPLTILSLPIRILRTITDPLIDFLLDTLFPWLWASITSLAARFVEPVFSTFMDVGYYLDVFAQYGQSLGTHVSTLWEAVQSTLFQNATVVENIDSAARNQSLLEYWLQDSAMFQSSLVFWNNLAFGTSYFYKMSTVGVGYLVLGLVAMWYLARTENMYGQNVVRAARRTIQLAGSCLKVIFFIVIELILFPIICGYLLDISTLPVFPNASISSRWLFQRQSPITCIFLHWFAGTGFMFHFSVFIAQCRKVVRPGVMWFIRDPNDPQFHPMREILERSVFAQLRKIAVSGLMYMGMILLGLGTVVYAVAWISSTVLPLRLDLSAAVSNIPIDLLVYHLVIPLTLSSTRPKRIFTGLFEQWWRITSRSLRLTSFMFGGRKASEEYSLTFATWQKNLQWIFSTQTRADAILKGDAVETKDGGFLRVPNFDSAPLNPQRRMLIPVEEDGTPINPADAALLNDSNTNIVYSPPNFKFRLIAFLFLMWFSGSMFGCTLLITPLLVGRLILGRLLPNLATIHDGYSFFTGLYFVWGCLLALEWVLRKFVAYYNWNGDLEIVKQTCRRYIITLLKFVYIFVTLGMIIPCLMSLAVQLYIVYPIVNRQPQSIPVFLLQNWAIGVIYGKIAYQLVFILPENRWSAAINQITQGQGLRNPDIVAITKSLVLPIGGTALGAVIAPVLFAYATERYQGSALMSSPDTYRLAYPVTLTVVVCYFVQKKSIALYYQWMGSIRDEEYVIGRKLENFQHVSKAATTSHQEPETSDLGQDQDDEAQPLLDNHETDSEQSSDSESHNQPTIEPVPTEE